MFVRAEGHPVGLNEEGYERRTLGILKRGTMLRPVDISLIGGPLGAVAEEALEAAIERDERSVRGPLKPLIAAAQTHMDEAGDQVTRPQAVKLVLSSIPDADIIAQYERTSRLALQPVASFPQVGDVATYETAPGVEQIDRGVQSAVASSTGDGAHVYRRGISQLVLGSWAMSDQIAAAEAEKARRQIGLARNARDIAAKDRRERLKDGFTPNPNAPRPRAAVEQRHLRAPEPGAVRGPQLVYYARTKGASPARR